MPDRKSKKITKSRKARKPSILMDAVDRESMPQLARMVDLLDHQHETARLNEDRRLYGDMIVVLFELRDLLETLNEGDIEGFEHAKARLAEYMRMHPPQLGMEI